MDYFEFRDKRPSLDVVEWPGIEVTETELTEKEIEQWTQTLNGFSLPPLPPASAGS